MKEKIHKKSFWISLAAAIVLILNTCGVKVDVPYVNEIVEAVCGVLVLLGIILPEKSSEGTVDSEKETNTELETQKSDENEQDEEKMN